MISLTCGIEATEQRVIGEGRKKPETKPERETIQKRLLIRGNKLRAAGGAGVAGGVAG